jgi:DUF2975 family protein
MKLIGQTSFSRFLPRGLRALSVMLLLGFAGIGIATLACLILLLTGHLPAGRELNLIGLFAAGAALAVAYFIVRRLKDLFDSFAKSEPFDDANAGHLRALAALFTLTEAIKLAKVSAQAIFAPAAPIVLYSPNLMTWFTVLLLLALAEVFREGTRLRNEQNFTV